MSADVLLVNLEIDASEPCGLNLGLASIAGSLLERGISCHQTYVDSSYSLNQLGNVTKTIRPKIAGVSVVDSQVVALPELVECLRTNGVTFVCVGGPVATIEPSLLAGISGVDLIFRGEAELLFVEICQLWLRGRIDESISEGYVLRYPGQKTLVSLPQKIPTLSAISKPIRQMWYQDVIYRDGHATFMFSRGCHRSCSYCSNHAIRRELGLPTGYRYKPPVDAIAEIREIKNHFIFKKIHFHDDCFGVSPAWRSEFLKLYIREIGLPFSCNAAPEVATMAYLHDLKEAGCVAVSMGVECGDDTYRAKMLGRRITNACIIRAFQNATQVGLRTVSLTMVGLPAETSANLQATVNLHRLIKANEVCVYFCFPYRGTRLFDWCLRKGLVNSEWWIRPGERMFPLPGLSCATVEEIATTKDILIRMGNSL